MTTDDLVHHGERSDRIVVGIGASAGGLAALRSFFSHIPRETGISFVVVLHLSPDHESHLADVLQPYVQMPVVQVTETVPLQTDHVYVIPPGHNLAAVDTHLRLDKLEAERRQRAPIDHFFRTLGKTHDGQSIGVILTGTGSDGTLGLKDIKAHNGVVIVQEPSEAEFNGMPQSAVATGMVDAVLCLDEIPAKILAIANASRRVAIPHDGSLLNDEQRNSLHKIFAQIRASIGRDFSRYKRSTILRRISRRMQLCQITDLSDYLRRLREESGEVLKLADDLLITVTNFFRDAEVFERLENEVLPTLFEGKGPQDDVRVWSVGCATGEEAYSLAILLIEAASKLESSPRIQIFASDLHEHSLTRARDGFYPGDIATDVSAARLKRFFVKEEGGYRIRKEVRELVVFTTHNLMGDPPFSRIDLISCRNVMIYLQRDIQREIIELFHYALRPSGFLLLGTSETVDDSELFQTSFKKQCIYRKCNVPSREPRLAVFPVTPSKRFGERSFSESTGGIVSYGMIHSQMVERYAPPSMLVTLDDKIVHLSEHAGRYLVHSGGELTANAIKLVREELRIELRTLLHSVREKSNGVRSRPVRLTFNGEPVNVIMDARPATQPPQDGLVLVIFNEQGIDAIDDHPNPLASDKITHVQLSDYHDSLVKELQSEIEMMRQRMQVITDEFDNTQEEMKASNEELQSTNEELRSAMEELETSKEELQSMNEELQTVNQENRFKVEELAQLSSDLQNLLAATNIATMFLDRELRILRFTPAISNLFNVLLADRGRVISDFTHRLGYDNLVQDCQQLLKDLIPIEREIQDHSQRWYLTRILPYRSTEDRIEGVVITLVDITFRKQAEENLRLSQQRYRLLIEGATEYAILMLSPDGLIQLWNRGAERMFGYIEAEAIGQSGEILCTPEDRVVGLLKTEMERASRDHLSNSENWRIRKDGSRFRASSVVTVVKDDAGRHSGYAVMVRDNSERGRAETLLRESEARLRLACEATGFGSYDYDVTNDRSLWSPELLQMLKLPESTVVDHSTLLNFIHPDDRQIFLDSFTHALQAEREEGHDHQFRIVVDGVTRWIRDVGHTFFEQRGGERRPVRVVGMMQDISTQKEHEEMLEVALANAEAANQSRGEFLANMSHEIRTPMTAILGYVDILSEALHDTEHRRYLEIVRSNGRFLLGIINDILDLSKIDAGKMNLAHDRIVLAQLLAEVRTLMDVRANEKGLDLTIVFTSPVPEVIESDAIRIRQILVNLIGNAVKFTGSGSVQLVVSYNPQSFHLRFDVVDTGIGIKPELHEAVFQPFSQADNSTTRNFGGTGLGLAICRRLARMLNGDILVESQLSQGSTFSLSIYCPVEQNVRLIIPNISAVQIEKSSRDLIKLSGHILVVDDRRDIRFLVIRLLEHAGATTVNAFDGQQAVEIVRRTLEEGSASSQRFDAIVIDMQMPQMDGYQAVRMIRELGYTRPIIALTANAMQGDREQCVNAGCNGYLTKPINADDLLHLLSELLPGTADERKTTDKPQLT